MTENGTVRDFTVEMRRRESPMSEWKRFESDELRKVSIRVNRFMERFFSCAKMKLKPLFGNFIVPYLYDWDLFAYGKKECVHEQVTI